MNLKKPNPLHHNTGRRQSPKTELAGAINWLHLQVLGAQSNLSNTGFAITRHRLFQQLKPEVQEKLRLSIQQSRNVAVQLKDIAQEIADLNSPDKWSD